MVVVKGVSRKLHLFDIDIPGKIRFMESETLTPGEQVTMFETPFGKVGVGVCYDIRFPELAQLYAKAGAKLLLYPGLLDPHLMSLRTCFRCF